MMLIRPCSPILAATLALGLVPPAFAQEEAEPAPQALPYAEEVSVLKVCKVAGEGVAVGQAFRFAVGPGARAAGVSIPAGPGPGGWCKVVGKYPVGRQVDVREHIPAGYAVDSIAVEPANAQLSVNVEEGRVRVRLGPGVTEVTVVDSKHTGYIEICKTGGRHASYEFSYVGRDRIVRRVRIPTGACSPALEVPAGELLITELLPAPQVSSVQVWPASRLVKADPSRGQVAVQVPAGDISTQTIISIKNNAAGPVTDAATFEGPDED